MLHKLFLLLLFLTFPVFSFALPKEVLIIRHEEKIHSPAATFAAWPKQKGGSLRSLETVKPLSAALNLPQHLLKGDTVE